MSKSDGTKRGVVEQSRGEDFQLVQGDIADADTEAVVNAWNRNFIPHWLLIPQGVSKALRERAGRDPFREVGRKGLVGLGEVVATGAGEMDAEYMLHAAALHAYWRASEKSVLRSAENVFAKCRELNVESVAIPLLGAGTGGLAPEDSLRLIRRAFHEEETPPRAIVYVYERGLYDRLTRDSRNRTEP